MNLADQLLTIGKDVVPIIDDGNSVFRSIALQLKDPIHTLSYLRTLTYRVGLRAPHLFERHIQYREDVLLTELRKVKANKKWNPEVDNLMFNILTVALERDIVILRACQAPRFFPKDAEIDEEAIVIVQVDAQRKHYHSTKMALIKRLLYEGKLTAVVNLFVII